FRAVVLRAECVRRPGIQPGHADDQQAAGRVERRGAACGHRLAREPRGRADDHVEGQAAVLRRRVVKLAVVLPILAVLVFLRVFRARVLVWVVAWWIGLYVTFRYGFETPIP